MKNISKFLFLAIILIIILLGPFIFEFFVKESFTNLSPGDFPSSNEVPLLNDDYPLKKNPKLNFKKKYKKVLPSSYSQVTNNKRYWSLPDDDDCSPQEFCDTLYEIKKLNIPKQPPIIPFSDPYTRINFYSTCY